MYTMDVSITPHRSKQWCTADLADGDIVNDRAELVIPRSVYADGTIDARARRAFLLVRASHRAYWAYVVCLHTIHNTLAQGHIILVEGCTRASRDHYEQVRVSASVPSNAG